MKAATIYDVARRAGVSHQTVSRYLSGYEGIRPATRQRVEQALAELDYRQNTLARSLRLQQSNRIGVLADRIDTHGPARVLSGATQAAHRRGYLLDVVTVDGLSEESIRTAVDTLRSNQVAGILATAQTEIVHELLQSRVKDLPKVSGESVLVTADDISSNAFAGSLAADHLLDLGHRRIGYLGGPEVWIASRSRRDGFVDRVRQRGGELVWSDSGDWSAQAGFDAWLRCCSTDCGVTAIAAANDSMAIGIIAGAASSGIDVPGQLSVIGTDDIPEARFLVPGLTSIALDFEGEGEAFINALLDLVGAPDEGSTAIHSPRLAARGTTTALMPPR